MAEGLGLALKIEDGDDHRARPTVVIEALRQLGLLRDESLEAVSKYAFFPVKNRRQRNCWRDSRVLRFTQDGYPML